MVERSVGVELCVLMFAGVLAFMAGPCAFGASIYFDGSGTGSLAPGQTALNAFLAAIGDHSLEDFEGSSFPSDPGTLTYSHSTDDFTVHALNSNDRLRLISGTNYSGTFPISPDNWIINTTGSEGIVFDFSGNPDPLRAFGLWITDFGDTNGVLTFSDDSGIVDQVALTTPSQGGNGSAYFWGITGISPFTTVTFESTNSSTDGYGVDDVYYAFVPLPLSASLGLFGIGLLFLLRVRKGFNRPIGV